MIDVFFDGKCGLCSREIEYYRRIANDGIFRWHDIAQDPSPLNKFKIPQSIALRWLHLRDENGQWHIGADAFLVIWTKLERWNYLAFFLKLPGIKHLARLCYNTFANYRFNRLEHCQIAFKKELMMRKSGINHN